MTTTTKVEVARRPWGWLAPVLLAGLGQAATPAQAGDWQKVVPSGPVLGLDGRPHRASCSGYPGSNPEFNFWSRKGKSRNLLVYFEGGGACWDNLTCTFPHADVPTGVPQFYTAAIAPGSNPAIASGANPLNLDGLFNLGRDDNPVKDWSMVYVPYCSADLHGGAATGTYSNYGHPVFPLPSTFEIRHGGYDNTMVVLDWVKRNVAKPQKVLVAGSSAGGYGATINFPWLRKLYPQAQVGMLADASQGVTTPAFDQSAPGAPGRGEWNLQLPAWADGVDVTTIAGPQLLRRAAQAHPEVRVAQFTTNFDFEQINFYGVMKTYYGPGSSCSVLPLDWNRQMVATMNSDRRTLPNYRHYLAAGTYHTVLTSPQFYTERSTGLPFKDWVDAMVNGNSLSHWPSAACLFCLIELPCRS